MPALVRLSEESIMRISILAAGAASLLSVPALAQTTAPPPAPPWGTAMMTPPVEEDNDFPWGLLGLLGLAVLLGVPGTVYLIAPSCPLTPETAPHASLPARTRWCPPSPPGGR